TETDRYALITRRSQVQVLSPQPPRPGLKRPGLFLCYSAAKMQKFFAVLFDATHNIFLCVDKKDRRSHLKIRVPPVFFARKPTQNLPAGESGLKTCQFWFWKGS